MLNNIKGSGQILSIRCWVLSSIEDNCIFENKLNSMRQISQYYIITTRRERQFRKHEYTITQRWFTNKENESPNENKPKRAPVINNDFLDLKEGRLCLQYELLGCGQF